MHSRIFQVSKEPLTKNDYYAEERYWEDLNFVPSIADYVDEAGSKEDFEWLASALKGSAEVDYKNRTITITNKLAYFENRFKAFKETIARCANLSLEEFAEKEHDRQLTTGMLFYELKQQIESTYEFYLDDEKTWGCESLCSWMRHLDDGDVLYVGAVFDYHY